MPSSCNKMCSDKCSLQLQDVLLNVTKKYKEMHLGLNFFKLRRGSLSS